MKCRHYDTGFIGKPFCGADKREISEAYCDCCKNFDVESNELKTDKLTDLLMTSSENSHLEMEGGKLDKKVPDKPFSTVEEWELTFNTISDVITIHDGEYNIIQANKAAIEFFGLPIGSILGQKCYKVYHGTDSPPSNCVTCRSLKEGVEASVEMFEPHFEKHIDIKGMPKFDRNNQLVGVVHVVRDITSKKIAEKNQQQLTQQLIHSQKMEAIGFLTGGIAHDFNNILAAIIGRCELLMLLPPEDYTKESPQKLLKIAREGTKLTKQLLNFSRNQDTEYTSINLNNIINNMTKMLRCLVWSDIEIIVKTNAADTNIEGNSGQIEQILMNLVINASHAMPDGGNIIIETCNAEPDDENLPSCNGVSPTSFVLLKVTDTGEGIAREIQDEIFKPFFSTKDSATGTGLGLSIVYKLVEQHNGHIRFFSEENKGTIFKVYLPTIKQQSSGQNP